MTLAKRRLRSSWNVAAEFRRQKVQDISSEMRGGGIEAGYETWQKVMRIKEGSMPWITTTIQRYELVTWKISKYCHKIWAAYIVHGIFSCPFPTSQSVDPPPSAPTRSCHQTLVSLAMPRRILWGKSNMFTRIIRHMTNFFLSFGITYLIAKGGRFLYRIPSILFRWCYFRFLLHSHG